MNAKDETEAEANGDTEEKADGDAENKDSKGDSEDKASGAGGANSDTTGDGLAGSVDSPFTQSKNTTAIDTETGKERASAEGSGGADASKKNR